jgi:2-polyprenyl-3-methyl-5-hydroxy-6-metoxy-1,4-benzoquinol methylase
MNNNKKTTKDYWDKVWESPVRLRLPSRLNVGITNITSLLSKYVKPKDKYIEVGCAPAKLLSWVSSELKADASGIDYSELGIKQSNILIEALQLDINLYQDDFFNNKLKKNYYDVVTSFGFIEHFDDISPVVNKHIELLGSGGVAIIVIPNYSGIYGSIQKWCDPKNLDLHNTNIMNTKSLIESVNVDEHIESVNAFFYGSVNPWVVNLDRKLPKILVKYLSYIVNIFGLIQPINIKYVAPLIVLEVIKKSRN